MRLHVTETLMNAIVAAGAPADEDLVNPAASVALPDGSTMVLVDTSRWNGRDSYTLVIADEEEPTSILHLTADEVDESVTSVVSDAQDRADR